MEEANPYEAPAADVDASARGAMQLHGGGELASRGSRLAAKLLTALAIYSPAVIAIPADAAGSQELETAAMIVVGLLVLGLLGLNVYWLYDNGQTIGKRAMGIKIVRGDRVSRASLPRILFIRHLFEAFMSQCCGLLWLVDVFFIFEDERQCLHDKVADTAVIVDGTAPDPGAYAPGALDEPSYDEPAFDESTFRDSEPGNAAGSGPNRQPPTDRRPPGMEQAKEGTASEPSTERETSSEGSSWKPPANEEPADDGGEADEETDGTFDEADQEW